MNSASIADYQKRARSHSIGSRFHPRLDFFIYLLRGGFIDRGRKVSALAKLGSSKGENENTIQTIL